MAASGNTAERTALKQACDEAGLTQKRTKPTRDEHLHILDLVVTIPGTTTNVPAGIADHTIVTAELKFNSLSRSLLHAWSGAD